MERKQNFIEELKKELTGNTDFIESITKGTSGKQAKDTRFKIIRELIKNILEN
jgi:uncharacterized membrane-anchored protein